MFKVIASALAVVNAIDAVNFTDAAEDNSVEPNATYGVDIS